MNEKGAATVNHTYRIKINVHGAQIHYGNHIASSNYYSYEYFTAGLAATQTMTHAKNTGLMVS